MYNRYLSTTEDIPRFSSDTFRFQQPPPPPPPPPSPEKSANNDSIAGVFGSLSSLFSSKMHKPQLTPDNLVMFAIIYFLVADSDDFDTELLIIVGILLFLGV